MTKEEILKREVEVLMRRIQELEMLLRAMLVENRALKRDIGILEGEKKKHGRTDDGRTSG